MKRTTKTTKQSTPLPAAAQAKLADDEQAAAAKLAALEDSGASEKLIASASAKLNAAADAAQADYTTGIPRKATKAPENPKAPTAPKAGDDDEAKADRLQTTLAELKETKSGLVLYLALSGKANADIAATLQSTFKMSESSPRR